MNDYQKLTDMEILETLGNLKKELMAELCKLPELNENETVHLNASENVSADSRVIKCDGEVITSPTFQIGEHSIYQSPICSMSLKAEDTSNSETSMHKFDACEVNDICGNGVDNVTPGILLKSKSDTTGSINMGVQSLVNEEAKHSIKCEENKSDIGNEYQTSFQIREYIKEEEVMKHHDEGVPNIEREERDTMNLTEVDLNKPLKDEEDDTRLKHLNFTMPSLITNFGKPTRTMSTNEKYIGDLKLNNARISTCKGRNGDTKSKCYHKGTHNRSPPLIERKHRSNAKQKEGINVLPRVHKKVCDFICAHCGKSYTTKVHLRRHIQKHEEYISLQQDECKTIFAIEKIMKINFSHDETPQFQCRQCKKGFTRNENLKRHLRIHSGIRPYECPLCKRRFTENGHLKMHLRVHNGIRPYECAQCKKRFTQFGSLKIHLRIHDGIRPYECSQCKKSFTCSGSLKIHLRIHDGIRPYECPRCKKTFTGLSHLKAHLRIHDGTRPYECPQCKKSFTSSGYLKVHMRTHDGTRPYECPQCKKRFNHSGSLKTHLRVHDGIRPYECPQCKKRFTESGKLKMHLRVHSGTRPYECPLCKKRFSQNGHLKMHLRAHDGIRPYECAHCKKRFTQRGSLKIHLRIHDGIRSYE